jgi:hypothetical protein
MRDNLSYVSSWCKIFFATGYEAAALRKQRTTNDSSIRGHARWCLMYKENEKVVHKELWLNLCFFSSNWISVLQWSLLTTSIHITISWWSSRETLSGMGHFMDFFVKKILYKGTGAWDYFLAHSSQSWIKNIGFNFCKFWSTNKRGRATSSYFSLSAYSSCTQRASSLHKKNIKVFCLTWKMRQK